MKPAVNVAAPFIGMAVGAKTKHPKVAQATTIILKSISVGKLLSLTELHGHGLGSKNKCFWWTLLMIIRKSHWIIIQIQQTIIIIHQYLILHIMNLITT